MNHNTQLNRIVIGYSTVFGTSQYYAEDLQQHLENQDITSISNKIDNFGQNWVENYKGIIILFLSTTGDGQGHSDSSKFFASLKKLVQRKRILNSLKYSIIGFGSTIYSSFCGYSKEIQRMLNLLGAIQILPIQFNDSNLKCDNNINGNFFKKVIFNGWKKQLSQYLINSLKQEKNQSIKQLKSSSLPQNNNLFELNDLIQKQFKEKQFKKLDLNQSAKITLKRKLQQYQTLQACNIQQINQLRKQSQSKSPHEQFHRSTLHLKLISQNQLKLAPGCNIYVYPQNQLIDNQEKGNFNSEQAQLVQKAYKRIKMSQLATRDIINVIFNDNNLPVFSAMPKKQKLNLYKECLANKNLTVKDLIIRFKPKSPTFYAKLQFQPPRPYSLASWNQNKKQIQLCASIVPQGVTSNFFKSMPKFLKFHVSNSCFKIPDNRQTKILMIANGVGIAPFRSIAQYYLSLSFQFNSPPLKLYYGIQNQERDFYFRDQLLQYKKSRILQLKVAQSRSNPEQKEYVQDVIDKEVLLQYLLNQKRLIYVCGGESMSEGITNLILNILSNKYKDTSMAEQSFSKLKEKGIYVEEVFN